MSTVLVTGATDGLGKSVARKLVAEGHTVLIHGRNPEALEATKDEIGAARAYLADLASLDQVRALASDVREVEDRLDVLINNAGIGTGLPDSRERQESEDGYELRLQVNYLAGFLLTLELLPLLEQSAPARIVNVSSLGQAPIDFDDPQLERSYSGVQAYCQSKLAQVTFGFTLAPRIEGKGVTITSLHPSTYMPTKIVLDEGTSAIDTLERGTDATVALATGAEAEGVTGRFYDRESPAEPQAQASDPDAQRRLWDLSVQLTHAPAENA